MLIPTTRRLVVALTFAAGVAATAAAVQGGPPPEVRARIDAFTTALNGTADQWERMAKEHFAPALLAQRDAVQRRAMFERLRGDFGTITVGQITRNGPQAPLRLGITGSRGPRGTIELTLEPAAPFRITGIGVDLGGSGEAPGEVPQPPVTGAMSNEELARALDGYFGRLAADDVFSGVVLVAKNGTVVFQKAYGYADRPNRVPNTPATRFNLASINKIFTHTAIEQLVSRGKLSRADTVGKLLPDYPQELTRSATVEQLLGHRAGISDFFGDDFNAMAKDRFRSNADYYRLVSNRKPLFAPGERYAYCNGCFITLGAIIERVAGIPYEQYVQEHVYKPAGMAGAGWLQADAIVPNVAMGYTRRGPKGDLRANIYQRGAAGSAAGGGYATAADLLAFDRAMKSGALLPQDRVAGFYNGLGIAGGSPGTNAILSSGPVWTVVVLTNLDPPVGESVGSALGRALAR